MNAARSNMPMEPVNRGTAVSLTLEHLVKEHAVLKGLPLELISHGPHECARLHLPGDQIVRIYLDRDTPPGDVVPKLLVESDRLDREGSKSEVSFLRDGC